MSTRLKVRRGMLVRKRRRFRKGYGPTYRVMYVKYGEISGLPLHGALWTEHGPALKSLYVDENCFALDERWEEV